MSGTTAAPSAGPADPRPPRPGRGARWLIGLVVAAVLAVCSFVFLVVAMTGLDWSWIDELDGSATATVLNVNRSDHRYDDTGAGSVSVDLDFRHDGDRYVVNLAWPAERAVPAIGDRVGVVFDTIDPEATVELDEGQGSGSGRSGDGEYQVGYRTVSALPVVPVAEEPGVPNGNRHAWAWWASFGCGLASVVTVAATAVWATRIPAKPPLYLPGVHYGPPGYPGVPGQYPLQYLPGPHPQYPAAQHPAAEYPAAQYPAAQYPAHPAQPAPPSPPFPPAPGGYPPPS